LGLAICKRLIEQQGGSIRAINNPEGGSSFIVTLPVGKAGEVE
jgi:two-component system sensor histidine kinase KdpD